MTRIAMWSGPRNLSTAMMRSWENRQDTRVMDEPLYAAFLTRTGLDHPGAAEIIGTGIPDLDAAIDSCLAPLPTGTTVSYQKHMAHHLPADRDLTWTDGLRNCLLLRDPRRVLASYTKVRETVTLDDIGIPQQVGLLPHCEIVIDAADFLADPEGYQREICRRLDIAFDEAMLSWPAGRRESDGVWAKFWYDSVDASTEFGPPPTDPPPELPEHLRPIADEALDIYTELAVHALRLGDLPG